MHVPDGFLDAPTSIATGVVAAGGVALALRGARRELDERVAPLAGLVAVFVFAGQMINFPVGVGTSGHLIGAALAVALVGPWTALLCLTVVVAVQALLFADGGISALGTNIVLLAIVPVLVAALVLGGARRLRNHWAIPPVAAVAGLLSVPAAALAFVGLYAVGGAAPIPLAPLTTAMVGWHLLIGVGEAVITALAVSSIMAVRPDLVRAARPMIEQRPLEIRTSEVAA